jgi:quinol monooxygenase YgiN
MVVSDVTETESSEDRGNGDTVTVIGTMKVKPEHEEEFVELATRVVQAVHEQEPGTILYVLHKHPSEPHTYVWVERYRDEGAHQAHVSTSYFADAVAKLPDWLSAPAEFEEFSQLAPA